MGMQTCENELERKEQELSDETRTVVHCPETISIACLEIEVARNDVNKLIEECKKTATRYTESIEKYLLEKDIESLCALLVKLYKKKENAVSHLSLCALVTLVSHSLISEKIAESIFLLYDDLNEKRVHTLIKFLQMLLPLCIHYEGIFRDKTYVALNTALDLKFSEDTELSTIAEVQFFQILDVAFRTSHITILKELTEQICFNILVKSEKNKEKLKNEPLHLAKFGYSFLLKLFSTICIVHKPSVEQMNIGFLIETVVLESYTRIEYCKQLENVIAQLSFSTKMYLQLLSVLFSVSEIEKKQITLRLLCKLLSRTAVVNSLFQEQLFSIYNSLLNYIQSSYTELCFRPTQSGHTGTATSIYDFVVFTVNYFYGYVLSSCTLKEIDDFWLVEPVVRNSNGVNTEITAFYNEISNNITKIIRLLIPENTVEYTNNDLELVYRAFLLDDLCRRKSILRIIMYAQSAFSRGDEHQVLMCFEGMLRHVLSTEEIGPPYEVFFSQLYRTKRIVQSECGSKIFGRLLSLFVEFDFLIPSAVTASLIDYIEKTEEIEGKIYFLDIYCQLLTRYGPTKERMRVFTHPPLYTVRTELFTLYFDLTAKLIKKTENFSYVIETFKKMCKMLTPTTENCFLYRHCHMYGEYAKTPKNMHTFLFTIRTVVTLLPYDEKLKRFILYVYRSFYTSSELNELVQQLYFSSQSKEEKEFFLSTLFDAFVMKDLRRRRYALIKNLYTGTYYDKFGQRYLTNEQSAQRNTKSEVTFRDRNTILMELNEKIFNAAYKLDSRIQKIFLRSVVVPILRLYGDAENTPSSNDFALRVADFIENQKNENTKEHKRVWKWFLRYLFRAFEQKGLFDFSMELWGRIKITHFCYTKHAFLELNKAMARIETSINATNTGADASDQAKPPACTAKTEGTDGQNGGQEARRENVISDEKHERRCFEAYLMLSVSLCNDKSNIQFTLNRVLNVVKRRINEDYPLSMLFKDGVHDCFFLFYTKLYKYIARRLKRPDAYDSELCILPKKCKLKECIARYYDTIDDQRASKLFEKQIETVKVFFSHCDYNEQNVWKETVSEFEEIFVLLASKNLSSEMYVNALFSLFFVVTKRREYRDVRLIFEHDELFAATLENLLKVYYEKLCLGKTQIEAEKRRFVEQLLDSIRNVPSCYTRCRQACYDFLYTVSLREDSDGVFYESAIDFAYEFLSAVTYNNKNYKYERLPVSDHKLYVYILNYLKGTTVTRKREEIYEQLQDHLVHMSKIYREIICEVLRQMQ